MGVERKEDIASCLGHIRVQSIWKTLPVKVNANVSPNPAIPLPALYPRDYASGDRTGMFTAELFVRAKRKTTYMPINRRTENTLYCVQTTDYCVSCERK